MTRRTAIPKRIDPLVDPSYDRGMAGPRKKVKSPRRMTNIDDRRQQIISHTLSLYKSRGMDAVSYVDIAEACGVTRRLIQHYFPQPADLRMDAVKQIRDHFQDFCLTAIQKHGGARDQLIAYVGATCDWVDRYTDEARVWLLYFYYCGVDPAYRTHHSQLLSRANLRIQNMLKAGQAEGAFENAKDLEVRAKLIQNTIAGIMLMKVTEDGKPSDSGLRRRTTELCLTLALAKRPSFEN